MSVEFVHVPANMGPEHLSQFREMMALVVAHSRGRQTVDNIIGDHRNGLVSVWATIEDGIFRGMATTRIIEYPSGLLVFRIDDAAGNLEDAVEYMPRMFELAREAGCDKIRIEGREGWKGVFPDWHHVSTIIEKEIDYDGH